MVFISRNIQSISKISNLLDRPYSSIRNYTETLKKEIVRNNKTELNNIDHNELIKQLGNEIERLTFHKEKIRLYSEHIRDYNYDISHTNISKNIDLIGFYREKIIFACEFENHNLNKSFFNLYENFREVPLRTLYVNPNKLSEAKNLRDQYTNEFELPVYKYYENFEKDFVQDLRRILNKILR